MWNFRESIIELIKKDIASGLTLTEALQNQGAKKWSEPNIYYIPYGLYEDKVLLFKIQ